MPTPSSSSLSKDPLQEMCGGRYGVVPADALADVNISRQARFIYAALCTYADIKGICYPPLSILSAVAGVTGRRVQDYLSELERNGRIEKIPDPGKPLRIRVIRNPKQVQAAKARNLQKVMKRHATFAKYGRMGATAKAAKRPCSTNGPAKDSSRGGEGFFTGTGAKDSSPKQDHLKQDHLTRGENASASLARSPEGGELRSGASDDGRDPSHARGPGHGPKPIGAVLDSMLPDSGNGKDVKTSCSARETDTVSPGEHEQGKGGVDRERPDAGVDTRQRSLGPIYSINGGAVDGGAVSMGAGAQEDAEDVELAEAMGIGVDEYREIKEAKAAAVANLGAFPVAMRVLDLDRRLKNLPAEAREGVRLMEYRLWADEGPDESPAATGTGRDGDPS